MILEYLQATYDTEQKFKPHTPAQQREYNYWMHYAEGSLMPLLVMSLVMSFVPQRVPFIIRPLANKIVDGVKSGFISPRLNDHVPFLENHLNAHEYFAGEFSFADIQMSFPMIAMQERMQGKYPHMKAFVERIKQRPAYQRAQAKGD